MIDPKLIDFNLGPTTEKHTFATTNQISIKTPKKKDTEDLNITNSRILIPSLTLDKLHSHNQPAKTSQASPTPSRRQHGNTLPTRTSSGDGAPRPLKVISGSILASRTVF
jgi:hypothetical protein